MSHASDDLRLHQRRQEPGLAPDVNLSEFGRRIATGLGATHRTRDRRGDSPLEGALTDALPEPAGTVSAVSLQHIARILVWIGGPRGLPADTPSKEHGADPRSIGELEAAEQARIIQRSDGGVRLAGRGGDLAATEA